MQKIKISRRSISLHNKYAAALKELAKAVAWELSYYLGSSVISRRKWLNSDLAEGISRVVSRIIKQFRLTSKPEFFVVSGHIYVSIRETIGGQTRVFESQVGGVTGGVLTDIPTWSLIDAAPDLRSDVTYEDVARLVDKLENLQKHARDVIDGLSLYVTFYAAQKADKQPTEKRGKRVKRKRNNRPVK